MNHSDSERIASFLESANLILIKDIASADLVIINTCGIRQAAENRVYSQVHNLRKAGNNCKIIITGCIAHRADVQKRLKGKVDAFCETKDIHHILSRIVHDVFFLNPNTPATKQETIIDTAISNDAERNNESLSKEHISYLSIQPKHTSNFQALVPIMTGCNNFCSYCVVPYARGREISRSANDIITEVSGLVRNGYKQITLLGQNVNSYASPDDTAENETIKFPGLLEKINRIPGKFWITFVSSHPKDMSDELIETVAKCKKACEWVHLPVQAGDDTVLKNMNRHYTRRHYLDLLRKIRISFEKYKPELTYSITSDIIVGFPGETELQFEQSAILMRKAKFDMVYFGQFSPRPRTQAYDMQDTVSNLEKEHRESMLNEILKKTALANNKKYIGKKLEVLIEQEKDGYYLGKTRSQKNIKFPAKKKGLVGKFTTVLIMKANTWNLEG